MTARYTHPTRERQKASLARHRRQQPVPERPALNYQELAARLVSRGICSPAILGPRPRRRDAA